jgi:hypothetical protein
MLLSFESPLVGAFAVDRPRAMLLHRNGLVSAVPPESDWNMCKRTIGVPQELGSSCRFLGSIPAEIPGYQLQASAVHSSVEERTQRVQPRYHQTKETKCGGMDGRKS